MEAFIAIAIAVGWAYYQISNQNKHSNIFDNLLAVFSAFGYMFIVGLVIFLFVMVILALFGRF